MVRAVPRQYRIRAKSLTLASHPQAEDALVVLLVVLPGARRTDQIRFSRAIEGLVDVGLPVRGDLGNTEGISIRPAQGMPEQER